MRRIDHAVHPLLDQRHGPLPGVTEETDRRAHPEPAGVVLGGVGVLVGLDEVLEGDQTLEAAPRVDYGQLLDLVLRQERQGLIIGDADGGRHQGHPRHHLMDRTGRIILETQVAIGDDAEQHPVVINDRQARDAVLGTGLVHLSQAGIRTDGHRLGDHARLRPLHLIHHVGLGICGEVPVQDPDAALARHGDGHAGLGDGVHRSRRQGNVQADVAAEPG